METKDTKSKEYIKKRKKLSGFFFETALPNEYLVKVGQKKINPILGGKRFRLFSKFLRVPASVQTLYFITDNANLDYQGIGIEGYASWRIDPKRPEVAITTMDFFDDDDPMENTNNELKTICTEAVRHVIANMTIDDALKKKDEIGDNLRNQLKEIEDKWGIIFDQVGIEKVQIMSNKLFENLQSQFRDKLRLEVAKTKIETDKQIAKEENIKREKTELEKIETDKKINLANVENDVKIKEFELDEHRKITQKEREIRETEFRKEIEFKKEQEEKENELELIKKNLEIKFQDIEKDFLVKLKTVEEKKNEMLKQTLDIEKLRREINQIYSSDELTAKLIEILPQIYEAIKINNYSVIDSGNGEISPVTKFLQEIMFLLKNNNINFFKDKK